MRFWLPMTVRNWLWNQGTNGIRFVLLNIFLTMRKKCCLRAGLNLSRFEAMSSGLTPSCANSTHCEKLYILMKRWLHFNFWQTPTQSSQRLSLIAAAAPNVTMQSPTSTINVFVRTVKYETVATGLWKCDDRLPARASSVCAACKAAPASEQNSLSNRRRKTTKDEICTGKATKACRRCRIFQHWRSDHLPDGWLPS